MVLPTRPPANRFVASMRKLYNPLGFSKGYNFVLFFIFSGALMGFTLARLNYISFDAFCKGAAPGECFHYRRGHEKAGIIIHLAGILPAGFLACFQFVPVIRHKAILFHRLNGYIILLLSLVSTAGAFMIARHAFGGGLEVQAVVGLAGIMFVVSLTLAYVNIKRLQIEQHRAWMLRAWFYAGSIVTLRLIQFSTAAIISRIGTYYAARSCGQVAYTIGDSNRTLELYPDCAAYFSGANPNQQTIVHADILTATSAAEAGAAVSLSFGMAFWLALAIHAVGVEIYLRLTPAEAERLRNVSYKRQLEAGMSPAGRAGLTADRLGDSAEWHPKRAPSQADSASLVSH
ncbi:hypothetical protein LY76DRAFT_593072 [Colletotrichum caudatum]|nr:hypothetical protein LY76DRAFT_593072 [Colletotrichum caudatum]